MLRGALIQSDWSELLCFCAKAVFSASIRTREHHLDEVPFVDVFCRGQPLQDVLVVQVVAEKQDLVVHAEEAALWELGRGEDTSKVKIDFEGVRR